MSRRDLSQPSFVDALVSGYGKVGGFLDRIEQVFDWPAFEALLSPIHASARGAPPLVMFKIVLFAAMAYAVRSRSGGGGAGSKIPSSSPSRRRPPATTSFCKALTTISC
jgi:hypothetical protein